MTIDEAIDIFKCIAYHNVRPNEEDIEQAIKVLKEQQTNTELIIKTTIKEYLDKFYLDTNELLIDLNHDLCKRIRCGEVEK